MKKMNFSSHVPVKALVPGSRLAVHIPGTGMAWVEASDYAAAIVRIVQKTLKEPSTLARLSRKSQYLPLCGSSKRP